MHVFQLGLRSCLVPKPILPMAYSSPNSIYTDGSSGVSSLSPLSSVALEPNRLTRLCSLDPGYQTKNY